MCKIITVINKNKKNNTIINELLKSNIDQLVQEKDGYSLLRNNKPYYYIGDSGYRNIDKNIQYKGEQVYILHTRTATSIDRSIEGLHLQEIQGWYFAHNGVIGGYHGVQDKSDSYYFFKNYLKNHQPSKKILEKEISKRNFNGKAFLYNPKTKNMIFFCNSKSYIYLYKDCLIISTFELSFNKKTIITGSELGYTYIYEIDKSEPIQEPIYSEEIDDTYIKIQDTVKIKTELNKYDYTLNYQFNNTYEHLYKM